MTYICNLKTGRILLMIAVFCFSISGFSSFSHAAKEASHATPHHVDADVALDVTEHGNTYEELHHEVEGLPQLDFTTYTPQIFWMAVLFLILYLFFAKKTLPEISGVVENRKTHIESDLKTAEELAKKADTVQESYKEKLNQAHSDAMAAVKEVENKAKAKVEDYLQSFQAKAEKEIADAEASVEQAKASIMSEMDTIVMETADCAVEKIIGTSEKKTKKKAA